MNVAQLHNAIYNWLDRVGSPRFTSDRRDGAINGVIDQILEENFDRLSGDPMKFFEGNSKVRAILAPLVKPFYNSRYLLLKKTSTTAGAPTSGNIVFRYGQNFETISATYDAATLQTTLRAITGLSTTTVTGDWTNGFAIKLLPDRDDNCWEELVVSSATLADASSVALAPVIIRNYNSSKASDSDLSYDPYFIRDDELPDDMRYIVSFKINIEGDDYFLKNITKLDKNQLFQNPYKEPTLDYDERQYFDKTKDGIKIYCGSDDDIYSFELVYIKDPATVSYGIEHASTDTGISSATDGIVVSATATVDGVDYVYGDEVSFTSTLLTAGTVVYNFVNSDLGTPVHEDIAYRAAIVLLTKAGDMDKAAILAGMKK